MHRKVSIFIQIKRFDILLKTPKHFTQNAEAFFKNASAFLQTLQNEYLFKNDATPLKNQSKNIDKTYPMMVATVT